MKRLARWGKEERLMVYLEEVYLSAELCWMVV